MAIPKQSNRHEQMRQAQEQAAYVWNQVDPGIWRLSHREPGLYLNIFVDISGDHFRVQYRHTATPDNKADLVPAGMHVEALGAFNHGERILQEILSHPRNTDQGGPE